MNDKTKCSKCDAVEKCLKNFEKDYNCCETMLLSFSELLGHESKLIPKIATPFGGGIYGRKYMCGALTGAVMAIGLKHGRSTPKDDREISTEKSGRIVEKFIKEYGSVSCIEILGYEPGDLEAVKRDKQRIRTTVCAPLIKKVAEWLWEELF